MVPTRALALSRLPKSYVSAERSIHMDSPPLKESISQTELGGLAAAATVTAVVLGPNAITVSGSESPVITAVSMLFVGVLVFVVGSLTLVALDRR